MESWLSMAEESLRTSRIALEENCYRSAVSRAYYALYQAATAIFLKAGLQPPARGNWAHEGFPKLFEEKNVRRLIKKHKVSDYKAAASRAFFFRCDADYGPLKQVDAQRAKEAQRWAGMMLVLAREVVKL